MKLTTELLRETALYIKDYYDNHFTLEYSFHNYNRTVNIVRNCDALAVRMNLDKQQSRIAHLAAWFLELGYSGDYYKYQEKSVELARAYFNSEGTADEEMEQIVEAIFSTREPPQPLSVIAQIICDAGTYHLGIKDTHHNLDSLRTEYAVITLKEFTDEEWMKEKIKMIADHFYFSAGARDLFQKRKDKMLAAFQNKLKTIQGIQNEIPEKPDKINVAAKQKIIVEDDLKLERGVETFYRITERRHMELSKNAHDKASLLISVNSIIISIVLSVLFTKLEDNKYLLLPTLLLVITCTSTIILAILSTRPRLMDSSSKNKPLDDHEINILFFGDFSKLSLPEYKKEMESTYKNRADLYDSLSTDIYYQGVILVWKYKYIRISYNIFMYGFIITILSFMIAFAVHTA